MIERESKSPVIAIVEPDAEENSIFKNDQKESPQLVLFDQNLLNELKEYQKSRGLEKELKDSSTCYEIEIKGFNADMAQDVIQKLEKVNKVNPKKPIAFNIYSNGGSVQAMLDIYHQMRYMENPISTYTKFYARSAGAFLLAAGDKGKRSAYEDAQIMIHQIQWEYTFKGSEPERKKYEKRLEKRGEEFIQLFGEFVKKDDETIEQAKERVRNATNDDTTLTAREAKEFGIIDVIIPRKKNPGVPEPRELQIWEKGKN